MKRWQCPGSTRRWSSTSIGSLKWLVFDSTFALKFCALTLTEIYISKAYFFDTLVSQNFDVFVLASIPKCTTTSLECQPRRRLISPNNGIAPAVHFLPPPQTLWTRQTLTKRTDALRAVRSETLQVGSSPSCSGIFLSNGHV